MGKVHEQYSFSNTFVFLLSKVPLRFSSLHIILYRRSLLILIKTAVHNALLSSLAPLRLSRFRDVCPDEACSELISQSTANADSLPNLCWLPPAVTNNVAATHGSIPHCSNNVEVLSLVNCCNILLIVCSSLERHCHQ
ncbi:hypothetical protein VCE7224_00003 [Vibrio celticus]|uniref:Uncharacterized protein n=1 Tax=Vibrio celticus TaxID=446372 RepID=A0A1C3J8D0_9VIBR|nr:hypothetical protein VCE7224_00003 [Vibrio celticus]